MTNIDDMDLQTKILRLGALRDLYSEAYDKYQELKAEYDMTRFLITQEMGQQGIKSLESGPFLTVRTVKPDLKLTDEAALLNWLQEQPNLETDMYIGLKWTNFKPVAKTLLKKDGEIPPGTELTMTESVTLKLKEKGEQDNG